MARRNHRRWLGATLVSLPALLFWGAELYNAIYCSRFPMSCPVAPLMPGEVLGISLGIVGLSLPILGSRYRQHPKRSDQIQDYALATIYFLAGVFLFVRGWTLEPILQLIQWMFIQSISYLAVKDIYK